MESDEARFKHVGLSSDGAVVFCELDNGAAYAMPLRALEQAEDWDPEAKPQVVCTIHDDYAALIEFDSGLKIDFSADFVLSICEPSFAWRHGKKRSVSGIGGRIREIREARGLTLDALAAKCGIAKPNLSRLENNKVTPKVETLKSVAAALGTHPVMLTAAKKPDYALTWTLHEFNDWKRGLVWDAENGGSDDVHEVSAVKMVGVFLALHPEHSYARVKLLEHAKLAAGDLEPYCFSLAARKWPRAVKMAREALNRAKRRKARAETGG